MTEKTASAKISGLVEEGMTYAQAYKVVFPAALEKTAAKEDVNKPPPAPPAPKTPPPPRLIDKKVKGSASMPATVPLVAGFQKNIKAAPLPKMKIASKPTFSPAMDESPALTGGQQSRLPDKVQAAILKKKLEKKKRKTASVLWDGHKSKTSPLRKKNPLMIAQEEGYPVAGIKHDRGFVGLAGLPKADTPPYRMEPYQKFASVTFSGLRHASSALYDAYCDRGLEKTAFLAGLKGMFSTTQGVGRAAGLGAALGGLGGMGVKGQKLYRLATASGKEAIAARNAIFNEASLIRAGQKPGKILSGKHAEILRQEKYLKRVAANPNLKSGKSFADAPMDHLKEMAPDVLRYGAQTGALGALAGAGGKMLHGAIKRRKMINTAKQLAIPAAVGLGGYALLKD